MYEDPIHLFTVGVKLIFFFVKTSNKYCYNVVFLFHSFLVLTVCILTQEVLEKRNQVEGDSTVQFEQYRYTRVAVQYSLSSTGIQGGSTVQFEQYRSTRGTVQYNLSSTGIQGGQYRTVQYIYYIGGNTVH